MNKRQAKKKLKKRMERTVVEGFRIAAENLPGAFRRLSAAAESIATALAALRYMQTASAIAEAEERDYREHEEKMRRRAMAVYIIQDILEDDNHYIASRAALEDAQKLVRELEEFDTEENAFLPNRYKIRERGYCYNDYSENCGHCMNGICMLQSPDIDCPLVRKRAAAMAAGDADQPMLMPGA